LSKFGEKPERKSPTFHPIKVLVTPVASHRRIKFSQSVVELDGVRGRIWRPGGIRWGAGKTEASAVDLDSFFKLWEQERKGGMREKVRALAV